MRQLISLVAGLTILFVSLFSAQADNRVAPSLLAAPHVNAMTTPGVCPDGYSPGVYNTIRQCIRCDYGATYYPLPYPPVCAACPDGYNFNAQVRACFPR